MPLKKDGKGKRWVEMELLAPGTPEQVWSAMATGDGNAAWFTRAKIDGRVGGELRFEFGPGVSSSGEVTVWEPPHRFGYEERGWNGDAPPVATEIVITARGGDQCVVRMVHSLFSSSDDWDDQLEGFESGWPGFFEVLKLYLQHFAGMSAASFMIVTKVADEGQLDVWVRLLQRLDLTAANVGEKRTTPRQPEMLSGIVEHVQQSAKQRWMVLRLDTPGPAVALLGTYAQGKEVNVSMCLFFYGDRASEHAAASESRWRTWLTEDFAKTREKLR
jgi:uncharacterized protein YndB with AHSA1/START domain